MAYYPANVIATSLSAAVDSSTIDIPVVNGASYPDPAAPGKAPYKVLVGYDTSREEVCLVTAKPTADMLRVTRGYDTSPATAKNAGDVVVPGVNSADFTYFQQVAADATAAAAAASAHADTVSAAMTAYVDAQVAAVTPAAVTLQAPGPSLVTGVTHTFTGVVSLFTQGASLGTLDGTAGTFTLASSGTYQCHLSLYVSTPSFASAAGSSSGIVKVNNAPRTITFTATSLSTPYGMELFAAAPGLTSGAVGHLTAPLQAISMMTPFTPSDVVSPLVRLSIIKLV